MDYFAVMNASGSCAEGGSYQQEVIVGDEDPSLSFVGSPSWAHTFEEIAIKDDLMYAEEEDALVGISGLRNEEDDNDSSCHNPEEAIDGMSDCSSTENKDESSSSLFMDYENKVSGNKRKRGIDKVDQNDYGKDNYSRLLAGCKIIKKECSDGFGYLEEIAIGGEAKDDLAESSHGDDELHTLDEGGQLLEMKREPRR